MQRLLRSRQPIFCVRFRDYVRTTYQQELMLQQEIDEHQQSVTALYMAEDTPHSTQILEDLQQFVREPNHPRYYQASWQSGDNSPTAATDGVQALKNEIFRLRGLLKQGKFTLFITALCLGIYIAQITGWQEPIMYALHYPAYMGQESEIWRYLTHTLVHLSPWHILFNLVWWWIFADRIEDKFGSGKLILLYLIAAIVSGVAQNSASGPAFFGLSGVVYAVLGFVFSVDRFSPSKQFNLPQGFFNMLLVGIALGFISPLIDVEMGNSAHISGLIIGLLLGFLQANAIRKA